MIGRRAFIAGLAATAAATPLVAAAQPVKIGWLTTGPHPYFEDFRRRLKDLGWVEGQNVSIEQRYAGDVLARLDELAAELLRLEPAVIGLSRLAILANPGGAKAQIPAAETAAARLRVQTSTRQGGSLAEIEEFFRWAKQERFGAAALMSSALFASLRQRIVALAAQHRVPTVYEHRGFVDAGGLMSYGPDFREIFRKAASYVDRILKGARPADLPIEQPTTFELVVNLKTATALGLTLPQSFLIRADDIIR